jgi:hypothetical protein
LREEHRLRVFENRVLRIFGPEREEDGSWGKLHNDKLQSLYSSPNIVRVIKSRRMRWAGHVARMENGRGVYRFLVGRPERKRLLGRPRQAMHFLQRSTHFSKTCCRPFAASFRRTVEQATVLGLPLRGSSFTFVSPSLKRFHHLKTAARLIASSP